SRSGDQQSTLATGRRCVLPRGDGDPDRDRDPVRARIESRTRPRIFDRASPMKWIAIVAVLGGVAAAQPTPSTPPSRTMERAIKLYDKTDYYSATIEL